MKNGNPDQRILLGIFIIIIGALSLADNLAFFSARDYLQFWPMVFIALGALKIIQANGRSAYVVGLALIATGTLMTLNHLEIIHFRLREWWPLFLIFAGLAVIFKDRTPPTNDDTKLLNYDAGPNSAANETASATTLNQNTNTASAKIDIVALMSGNQAKNTSSNFQGGEVSVVMAGLELDFRGASIQGEAVLNVFTVFGGINIMVPNDWTVINNCSAILGGIDDRSVPAMSSNKRLIIKGYAIMGGVEIKN